MHFKRLRLSGFKSFVDPTELHIEDGLTGVVGPNGCGKSNLLEALRWVMGENRSKSMRGNSMDDVIFSGTQSRPARNLADVTLTLDNSDRMAPAHLNDSDDLEVSRRIERESGSAYRLNGADVRAKDVQLLFADAATGAHSPALVSQGRIGNIINAKPIQRRIILEEAAGITGLHSRRKEAENRLRGAERNLLRLQDVMVQMEAQIGSLKRQARQATRYKNISGDIRQAEAIQLYLRWKATDEAVMVAEKAFHAAQADVAKLTEGVSALSRDEAKMAEALPQLRQSEAEAAAALHRLTVARENLEAEEERLKATRQEVLNRQTQIAQDKVREEENLGDSKSTLDRLKQEYEQLLEDKNGAAKKEKIAQEALQKASGEANKAETKFDELSSQFAAEQARRESLQNEMDNAGRRLLRLQEELERISNELTERTENNEGAIRIKEATKAVKTCEDAFEVARDSVRKIESERLMAIETRDAGRADLSTKRGVLSEVDAETSALERLLNSSRMEENASIVDGLTVTKGYEVALGAALGDDLEAPDFNEDDTNATMGWHTLPPLGETPALPQGATPLSDFVSGPASLSRRLSQVGVVDAGKGDALVGILSPGQRLVSKQGAFWRWDGFVRTAEAPTAAAIRLSQRNRLEELAGEQSIAQKLVAAEETKLSVLETQVNDLQAQEQQNRSTRGKAEEALNHARRSLQTLEREDSERLKRIAALLEAQTRVSDDLSEAKAQNLIVTEAFEGLSPTEDGEQALATARAGVENLRGQLSERRAEFDAEHRMQGECEQRLAQIGHDQTSWKARVARAQEQIKALETRATESVQQLKALSVKPDDMDNKRQRLLDEIQKADGARTKAANALKDEETKVGEKTTELKKAEATLVDARENRVRNEGTMENARERKRDITASIGEKFECPPSHLLEKVGVKNVDDLPDLESIERKLERIKMERERLGAVNLRADVELEEIDEQLQHLIKEKTDLEEAIGRLRQGINSLNREGRQRLAQAFDKVNLHFSELFVKMFGGGNAHLELVESDDPLEAGLEIMASPPGKKLQTLSLLSGGEQALTALSLIFAVFMTNPAPICVLDEVDAPLDDANVERFCDLLDDMTKNTKTRFLIVTHNAVTMSRMDRLFGVTMAERGVSQLVSVDLEAATELGAAA